MPDKKIRPIPKSKRDETIDALFGPDEEMDIETAEEILRICEVEPADLVSKLKSRLEETSRRLSSEGRTVPVPMQNAIKGLRETIRSSIKPDPMNVDPITHINNLLSGAATGSSGEGTRLSFRNRKTGEPVSKRDKELLEELKAEANSEMEG